MGERANDPRMHRAREQHSHIGERCQRLRRAELERLEIDLDEVGLDPVEVDRNAGGGPALGEPACVRVVLGEPLQELKPSVQATRNMNMSQCLFVTGNFAKSASLLVAMPGSEDFGARNLRAFWRNQFHSPPKQEEERRPASIKSPAKSAFTSPREAPESKAAPYSEADREFDSEAEDDARKPRPIFALGEQAYWVGSPLAGALYVLQGDLFLRISVGGIPKESTRIAKSKSLAAAILPRLHRNAPK